MKKKLFLWDKIFDDEWKIQKLHEIEKTLPTKSLCRMELAAIKKVIDELTGMPSSVVVEFLEKHECDWRVSERDGKTFFKSLKTERKHRAKFNLYIKNDIVVNIKFE